MAKGHKKVSPLKQRDGFYSSCFYASCFYGVHNSSLCPLGPRAWVPNWPYWGDWLLCAWHGNRLFTSPKLLCGIFSCWALLWATRRVVGASTVHDLLRNDLILVQCVLYCRQHGWTVFVSWSTFVRARVFLLNIRLLVCWWLPRLWSPWVTLLRASRGDNNSLYYLWDIVSTYCGLDFLCLRSETLGTAGVSEMLVILTSCN